jgi:hypothetical protein
VIDFRPTSGAHFLIDVRYGTSVPEAAPDGWVTVALEDDFRLAGQRAAFVYAGVRHPEAGAPVALRLRRSDELDPGSLVAAHASLRASAERMAAAGVE